MADQHVPGDLTKAAQLSDAFIQLETSAGEMTVYVVDPKAAPVPGLILVHEAFGLNEHIRDLARRFAAEGFLVAAPDLYSYGERPDQTDITSVRTHMFGLDDDQVTNDLEATARYLRFRAASAVGCVGFCSGGRSTLLAACQSDLLDCAVDCWGGFIRSATPDERATARRPIPPIDLVPQLRCPCLAISGEEDTNPSPEDARALAAAFVAAAVTGRVHVFTGAGHAFLADYRPTYRPEPAFRAWEMIASFLRENLKSPAVTTPSEQDAI